MALEHKDRTKFMEEKVWGTKHRIFMNDYCIVDRLYIKKGGFSSLHYHMNKWNRFFVEKGILQLNIEGKGNYKVGPGETYKIFDLRPGIPHQFRALESVICTEICYCEDLNHKVHDEDIIRLTVGGLNAGKSKGTD